MTAAGGESIGNRLRIAVIGAGVSGLAAARVLMRFGHDVVIYEKDVGIGGIWQHTYPDVRLQNVAEHYRLSDFPWPFEPEQHPTAGQVRSYLEALVAAFRLDVRLGHEVTAAEPEDHGWRLTLTTPEEGRQERVDRLVIAVGLYGGPAAPPHLPGRERFAGQVLADDAITDLSVFDGRKVAVVSPPGKRPTACSSRPRPGASAAGYTSTSTCCSPNWECGSGASTVAGPSVLSLTLPPTMPAFSRSTARPVPRAARRGPVCRSTPDGGIASGQRPVLAQCQAHRRHAGVVDGEAANGVVPHPPGDGARFAACPLGVDMTRACLFDPATQRLTQEPIDDLCPLSEPLRARRLLDRRRDRHRQRHRPRLRRERLPRRLRRHPGPPRGGPMRRAVGQHPSPALHPLRRDRYRGAQGRDRPDARRTGPHRRPRQQCRQRSAARDRRGRPRLLGQVLRHQPQAALFAAQAVRPQMRELGGGAIINFSSTSWRFGAAAMPAYATAKAAVLGLTSALARGFGDDNIRVNAIEPGAVMTERQRQLWYTTQESVDAIISRQVIKRVLLGEHIARMVLFLAADDSAMITKQSIIVDAGISG